MRQRRSIFTINADEGLNLTPLLDIIFNLVFFFILATTLRQNEAAISVNLPEATEAATQEVRQSDRLIINVTEANVLIVEGRVYTMDEFHRLLDKRAKDAKKEDRPLAIVVRGDRESNYETMISVMESCLAVGLNDISFQVEKKRE